MRFSELLKPKELPKHQKMCVGKGVISLEDGCIPLDNICVMDITLPQKKPALIGAILSALGLIIMFIPYNIFRAMGVYCFLFGILFMILIWFANRMRKYSLVITVNSGAKFIFQSLNIEYMRELLYGIQEAISSIKGLWKI